MLYLLVLTLGIFLTTLVSHYQRILFHARNSLLRANRDSVRMQKLAAEWHYGVLSSDSDVKVLAPRADGIVECASSMFTFKTDLDDWDTDESMQYAEASATGYTLLPGRGLMVDVANQLAPRLLRAGQNAVTRGLSSQWFKPATGDVYINGVPVRVELDFDTGHALTKILYDELVGGISRDRGIGIGAGFVGVTQPKSDLSANAVKLRKEGRVITVEELRYLSRKNAAPIIIDAPSFYNGPAFDLQVMQDMIDSGVVGC